MSNIGFIGLGIMGKPMALNLIKGGHKLFLNSRSGVSPDLTAAGGTACASAKEVAQKSDIVITMVPDTPDVEKALFGALQLRTMAAGGIYDHLGGGFHRYSVDGRWLVPRLRRMR